jgi:hypothetical protein
MVGGRMRLRYLKRKYTRRLSYVWPPAWGGPYGLRDTPLVRREGVLVSVRRIGHRLSVTLRLDRQEYVALLDEWNPPPTIDEVETALTRVLGRSIQDVGEVDVGREPAAPIPEDEYGY